MLAGQDFQRTVQTDNETVADYTCQLEKAFRVAFGNDKLGKKTKETMLYGQLQEGLHLGILHVRSPRALGAMSFKELCMATKNEEQVMPFGLMNAPSVFQRLMQQVVTVINPVDSPTFVTAYIDDLLVFLSTFTLSTRVTVQVRTTAYTQLTNVRPHKEMPPEFITNALAQNYTFKTRILSGNLCFYSL